MNGTNIKYTPRRFLRSSARSLREACEEVGRDDHGRECPDCQVRKLCEDESRWMIKRARKFLRDLEDPDAVAVNIELKNRRR